MTILSGHKNIIHMLFDINYYVKHYNKTEDFEIHLDKPITGTYEEITAKARKFIEKDIADKNLTGEYGIYFIDTKNTLCNVTK